jgi:hypothetical protein
MAEETTIRPSGELVVQKTGQNFPLTKNHITIGRVQGNDVVLDDSDISRHHASLDWDGQRFVVDDLKSTNGTFVNGVKITAPQFLENGDSIGLGGLTLSFGSSVAAATVPGGQATRVRSAPDVPPPPPPSALPQKEMPWLLLGVAGAAVLLILLVAALAAVLLLRPSDGPAVVITSPLTGSQVPVGEEVTVAALANDGKGVVRAELWVDNAWFGTVTTNNPQGQPDLPVEFQWIPQSAGSHTLDVRAYNSAGQISEPSEVAVNAVISVVLETAEPTVTPDLTPAGCTSNSAFVADVTIPDFTEVAPAQRLDKIWRLSNTGACTWDSGYQFVFVSGEQMNAAPSQALSETPPGGTADIQVTMYAPSAPGAYTGRWKLKDSSGQFFGTLVTIKVVVVAPEGPTPGPSDTPVLPPPDTSTPPPLPDTPTPTVPCVAAIDFRADDVDINAGDHTTLHWDVECVKEVYLDGAPVTGHGDQVVTPASTTTYTLHVVKNDNTTEDRQVTISVHSMGSPINANITYHSYDPSSGWVTFEIVNAPGSPTIECVAATIINKNTHANYYGPAHSDTPFRPNPISNSLQPSLPPGTTKYLRYRLAGSPTGVHCQATITLYTGDGKTGDHTTGPLEFVLPVAPPSVNANITYHSYDSSSGWVTFRVVNIGSVALESVAATIINRNTHANYYGPAYSDTPFRPNPTSSTLQPSLAPGATKYLRYKLTGTPTGVPGRATITVHTGNGKTGAHVEETVDFSLPSGAPPTIGMHIAYHSYDTSTGWVTFSIQNGPHSTALESVAAEIINRNTNAHYFGPSYSNTPFRPMPTTLMAGESSLAPGATKYLRFRLSGTPTGVPCLATITVYTGDGKTGAHVTQPVNFNLP